MNIAAWIATGVLVVVFAVSGVAKSTMSRDRLIAAGQNRHRRDPDAAGPDSDRL
jgi:excinuclease UvrABC ATPase subunit